MLAFGILAAVWRTRADSANLRIVEERQFPEGRSAPEVGDTGAARSMTPSVPDGVQTRQLGTVLDIGQASAHEARIPPAFRPNRAPRLRLRFEDGTVREVEIGFWTKINDDWWLLKKREDVHYYLTALRRRRTWQFSKEPAGSK